MKCEIIDGKLIVTPETPTERWAVEHWRGEVNYYNMLRACVDIEPAAPQPEPTPAADL